MPIICPECGGESLDPEICDHCDAELTRSVPVEVPETCPLLAAGDRLTRRQRQRLGSPEAALVLADEHDQSWRVHWLGRADFPRWFPLIEERARYGIDVLPPCRQIDDRHGLWLAFPCRGQPAQPWWSERAGDPLGEVRRLRDFAQLLAATLTKLHEHNLVWLNFDPEEIEEVPEGEALRLCPTNLDVQLFSMGNLPRRVCVSPAFAAPEICRGQPEKIGPASDVFHLGMFCYCWLARLLPDGLAGEGLEAFSYRLPAVRTFVHDLPPGLTHVLSRALAEQPEQRPPTPAAFMSELGDAIQSIERRCPPDSGGAQGGRLSWDVGAHTRAGRAKSALTGRNEDSVLVKQYADPPRALLAVADGISICDVGDGALASSTTLAVLEKNFADVGSEVDFARLVLRSSQEASQVLIDWAVKEGHEAALREGQNLMGTTLCVGWLQDNCLHLANRGDSRAYLVSATQIEQMTVDGDMASTLLAEGAAPEEVRQLGSMGKALRDCVGGCQTSEAGQLVPWSDALPNLSQVPLVPGDVVVLCSDGLVDEGTFLEPDTVYRLIQENRDLSAAELAVLLADEVDVLQRLPSSLEPDGFGDNISCIVVKAVNVLSRALSAAYAAEPKLSIEFGPGMGPSDSTSVLT